MPKHIIALTRLLLISLLLASVAPAGATGSAPVAAAGIEPQAGAWHTWVLSSGSAVRPAPPPNASATAVELDQVKLLAPSRSESATRDRITYWDAGAPSYRWVELGLNRILQEPVKSINITRAMALYTVAMYDATIATWDAKYTYNRPRPSHLDASLKTVVGVPSSPSYPSEHAATAAAAATVLGYLYPDDAEKFATLAEEASQSRVHAGVQFPSDVQAGMELGRAVGARVVEQAMSDGFDQQWTGTVPEGPGLWNGTNPLFPLAGTWKTWVLTRPDQFRPGPPPAWDSAEHAVELAEITSFSRTFDSNSKAFYAQTPDGLFGLWYALAGRAMLENPLEHNPPRAARAYALMGVAHHDALVACWDAKYTYWQVRPIQLDPAMTTLFPTPNHPSYPAAHGCNPASMATVVSYLFPGQSDAAWSKANDNAWSRLWAGIHYRSDIEAGLALGRSVGNLVVEYARRDGP